MILLQRKAGFKACIIFIILIGNFLTSVSFSLARSQTTPEQEIFQERNRQRSLILNAFSKTVLRSVEISLQEMKQNNLATWISGQSFSSEPNGVTLEEISEDLKAQILSRLKTSIYSNSKEGIDNAFERSKKFLRLDNRCLEEFCIFKKAFKTKRTNIFLERNISNLNSKVWSVEWRGVKPYVESRLGPLKELLFTLKADDQVILTNRLLSEVASEIPDGIFESRFSLPLSSYGKEIGLIYREGGKKALIIAAFDSKAYLLHYGLMISRFKHDNNLQFDIFDFIDSASLEKSYRQLLEFALLHRSTFSSLDALVIGYAAEFSEKWSVFKIHEHVQKGDNGETWIVSVFRFPEGKTVGVLGGDVDFYGENLARQLEQLIGRFPIPLVFFGGSGGALIPRPPYDLYVPSIIRSNDGVTAPNILTGSEDAGTHISVDSPLLETPYVLSRFQEQHFNTIDMEGGHLARLATRYGTKIGVGILVTDFPVEFASIDVSLGKQNFGAKKAARESFVNQVEACIRKSKKTFLHKIENVSGMTIREMSQRNLERLRGEIGKFSNDEMKFAGKIRSLPLRISVRMTPGRLFWTLRDRAVFSTGLVNSLGQKTSPYTPDIEDEMFGAFDYVFAEYSPNYGRRIYGDVILILKPEKILPRAWGTRISGWRVSNYTPGGSLEQHQTNFISEVFHSDHFLEAVVLQAIYRFRKLSPEKQERLLSCSLEYLATQFFEIGLGYLELKIKSYVMSYEIDRVMLPPDARGEIPGMLRFQGIPFEYYNPGKYSDKPLTK